MCGRYYIDEETAIELEQLVKDIDRKLNPNHYRGDIVPSVTAPVLTSHNNEMSVELLSWGFNRFDEKGLLINARAETIMEKTTFKECLNKRRCAVVASGFYEWDKSRNKFNFTQKESKLMLMAGLYNEEKRFVIITTKANDLMSPIHDRMPLVLNQTDVRLWLNEEKETGNVLTKTPPLLDRYTDMEQMRLEFF